MKSGRACLFVLLSAGLPAALGTLTACHAPSEKEEIRRVIDRAGKLAEKKDVPALLSLLSDDYRDFEGRDRADTESLVSEHVRRRFGIVVHPLHVEVSGLDEDGTAAAEADVALSSGAAELLRRALRTAGTTFRFRLRLRKTPDGWRIFRAEWEETGPEGLFPESLPALRDIFPGGRGTSPEG